MEFKNMIFTVAETADHLKVSRPTVYKLIKEGELKVFKIRNNTRITGEEIERYISERQSNAQAKSKGK